MRLAKVAKQLNVSIDRLAEKLASRGEEVEARPNTKLTGEQYDILLSEFQSDKIQKAESKKVSSLIKEDKEAMRRMGTDDAVEEPSKEEASAKKEPEVEPKEPKEKPVEAEQPKAKEAVEEKPAAPVTEKPEEKAPEAPKKEEVKAQDSAPSAEQKSAEKPSTPSSDEGKGDSALSGLKTKGTIDLDALERSQRSKPKGKSGAKPAAKKTETKPKKTTPPPKTTVILNKKSAADQDVVKASGTRLKGVTSKGSLDDVRSELSNKKQLELEEERLREQLRSNVENQKKKEAEEKSAEEAKSEDTSKEEKGENVIVAKAATLSGPTLTGQKIDLTQFAKKKKVASSSGRKDDANKRKRRRISTDNNKRKGGGPNRGRNQTQAAPPTEQEMKKAISDTLGKLTNKVKSKGSKYRRSKRDERREKLAQVEKEESANKVIQATEFVTVNEMASMMDVSVTEVISTCMMLGLMVTMNQRLDAETLQIVAEEFGYGIEFASSDIEEEIGNDIVDNEEDYEERAPVVTIMGHVDHGKTSLLDYIRDTNVISGEAGGITQHIGSYHVEMESGKKITFIDTPGHEAFTAMRARGAQVTDLVIIVISAEDRVMPQTKEAISHAQAANVPMIIAYNKIDKPNANADRIREELSQMNVLVEEWGGKLQSQEVSAKTGQGVQELLEKIAIEAELMELTANPKTNAKGAVLEASLDKGKGYVTNILVQNGTLSVGDFLLSGQYYGKVKAMHDERGQKVNQAGPSRPVSILGLNGAPQAGDKFIVLNDEKEAKSIATKRTQLQREQNVRTQKQMTLDEIGRRLSIGDFQELNLIIKGDVDGSIEALSDSLQKLSTESIQVNIVHKAVGQVTDSDVLLAAASQAIIIGFQVRPSASARRIAEKEEVEVRTYSIIYDAIDDIKVAMEGMLAPTIKEEIVGNLLIRETFKISKVGTIAGCYVTSGKVFRNSLIRIIRDGIVVHTGKLGSLKRFKDDVSEVGKGFECGLNIDNYNDIKVDDVIEVYQEVEQKTTL